MPKDQGQAYALYLSDTLDDSADPSLASNYSLVGFATENSISIDRELIEAANKESGADMEYVTGRRTPTVEGTFFLDVEKGSDQGQDLLMTEVQRDATDVLNFLLTDDISGHIQFYGDCLTETLEVTMPDQDMIELSATLQVQSGVTIGSTP